jgi:hypothetical protein
MERGELFKTAHMDGQVDSRSRIHRSHMRSTAKNRKKPDRASVLVLTVRQSLAD